MHAVAIRIGENGTRCFFVSSAPPGFHGEGDAGTRKTRRLGAVSDELPGLYVQVSIFEIHRTVFRGDFERYLVVPDCEPRRPTNVDGELAARLGEHSGDICVITAVTHCQRKRDIRALGHANLVITNHPASLAGQFDAVPCCQTAGNRDGRHQQDRLFVAVSIQLTEWQEVRGWEDECAGFKSVRQVPVNRRLHAGVPGVRPVGVPGLVGLDIETDRDRTASGW